MADEAMLQVRRLPPQPRLPQWMGLADQGFCRALAHPPAAVALQPMLMSGTLLLLVKTACFQAYRIPMPEHVQPSNLRQLRCCAGVSLRILNWRLKTTCWRAGDRVGCAARRSEVKWQSKVQFILMS